MDGVTGKMKTTSAVVSADGRMVTTRTGSMYELADALLVYREWCEAKGVAVDWDAPFGGTR
jgi:hypothetical protein